MLARITTSRLWQFLLHCMQVSVLGRVVGLFVGAGISSLIADLISSFGQVDLFDKCPLLAVLNAAIGGFAFGATMGSLQRFVLWRKIHLGSSWVLTTAVSWATGLPTAGLIHVLCDTSIGWADCFSISVGGGLAIGGILTGITQSFVLRCHVHKPFWWVLTGLGEAMIWFLLFADYPEYGFTWFILYVLLSGVLINWLLGQPKKPLAPPNQLRVNKSFRVLLAVVALALVAHCSFFTFIGTGPLTIILAEPYHQHLETELTASRSLWLQHKIAEYEIIVKSFNTPILWLFIQGPEGVELHVRNGEVIDAKGGDLDAHREDYQELIIEAMFDRVAAEIAEYDPREVRIQVKFNPEWGYVEWFRVEDVRSFFDAYTNWFYYVESHDFRPIP